MIRLIRYWSNKFYYYFPWTLKVVLTFLCLTYLILIYIFIAATNSSMIMQFYGLWHLAWVILQNALYLLFIIGIIIAIWSDTQEIRGKPPYSPGGKGLNGVIGAIIVLSAPVLYYYLLVFQSYFKMGFELWPG